MNKKIILKEIKRDNEIRKQKKEKRKNRSSELWDDPNFESLRSDHTKQPMPTKRSREIVNFYIAVAMIKRFEYLPWMSCPDVIGPNNERINSEGKIYTSNKFVRKTQSLFIIK